MVGEGTRKEGNEEGEGRTGEVEGEDEKVGGEVPDGRGEGTKKRRIGW